MLGNLMQLEQLDLSHNELTSLPIELRKLISLRSLNVSHNKLVNTKDGSEGKTTTDDGNYNTSYPEHGLTITQMVLGIALDGGTTSKLRLKKLTFHSINSPACQTVWQSFNKLCRD